MTIYTRRGDAGSTSLATGERVSKASARVEAYGTVDEANSAVGLAAAAVDDPDLTALLRFVQQRLFNCSSSLAGATVHTTATQPPVSEDDVALLERAVDRFEERTGPLTHFVIEGGSEASARLHVARTVVRRAERRVVELAATEPIHPLVESFLNRLSDALFAAARYANHRAGSGDVLWDPGHPAPVEEPR